MFNFLANIFEAIGSAVTVILVSIGLVVSPVPANLVDVSADEIVEEVTKKEVEAVKVISSTPIQPQSNPAPVVAEPSPKTSPQSSPKTFTTPSGAVVDEFGNIIQAPPATIQSLPSASSNNSNVIPNKPSPQLSKQEKERQLKIAYLYSEFDEVLSLYLDCENQGETLAYGSVCRGKYSRELQVIRSRLSLLSATNLPAIPTSSYPSTYSVIGDTIYGDDGTSYSRIGDTIYGSDGSSATMIGNTIIVQPGY